MFGKKLKISGIVCAILLVTVFQNCSSFNSADSAKIAASSQDPTDSLNQIQTQEHQLMQNPPNDKSQLLALIQSIQSLLSQVQALLNSSQSADTQTLAHGLIQQMTADINQLNQLIANLGTGSGSSSCSFNGQTIANGSSVTGFFASSVPATQTCQSQTRSCNNGQLSGSYTFAACTVAAPPSSVAVYTCGRPGFGNTYATLDCPTTMPIRSIVFYLYSQDPGSGVPIHDCTRLDELGGNLWPNACPSGATSNGIFGYVSNVQLPNSIPIYHGALVDGLGNPYSYLSIITSDPASCTLAACPQLGWVPAN